MKRILARALPKRLVNKLLNYQDWQNTDRFHQLQVNNFRLPKVRLQWWYFDFFLRDGSLVVLAFIPQHWWEESGSSVSPNAVFTMSLKTKEGAVKRFLTVIPQSELKTSANHLEIPSRFLLRVEGAGSHTQYTIQVNFPEVSALFTITPTKPPFAAFPTGFMPGILRAVLTPAPLNSPGFSYVSQIPNSTVSGSMNWDEYQAQIDGQSYHEQGRLNDTPARQGGSWTWFHFVGEGWNIFGSPGSYIYLQYGERIIRSGFQLKGSDYTLLNPAFTSPDHTKILTGGEINFRHEDLSFQLTLTPASTETLVCFPSANPNQIWGTAGGTATLSITEGAATKNLEGRMFLETCCWAAGEKLRNQFAGNHHADRQPADT